jgi:hypothetical protein
LRFDGPNDSDAEHAKRIAEPAWSFSLDFQVGQTEQPWKMIHTPDDRNKSYYGYTTGIGNPGKIAHTVCAIVTGTGGSLGD